MQTKTSKYSTFIGYAALLIWAASALFTAKLFRIPTFEILTAVFAVSFLISFLKIAICKEWHKLKLPLILWVVGITGVYGNDLLYIAAFKHAPAEQADLINYLWPILVILFSGLLPREQLEAKHVVAGICGFMGVFILITGGFSLNGFKSEYLSGYALAFADAIVWSSYTLISRKYNKTPVEAIGLYCGFGAVFSLLTHFSFEVTIVPTGIEWVYLLLMGLTTQGIAYFLWDIGVKKGNFKLLSVLSYGNPAISVALLVVFGMAKPSSNLLLATIFITSSALIAVINWQHFRDIVVIQFAELSNLFSNHNNDISDFSRELVRVPATTQHK